MVLRGKSLTVCSAGQKYCIMFNPARFREIVIEVLYRKYSEKGKHNSCFSKIYDFNEVNVRSVHNFAVGGIAMEKTRQGIKEIPIHQAQRYVQLRECLDNFILPGNEILLQLNTNDDKELIKSMSRQFSPSRSSKPRKMEGEDIREYKARSSFYEEKSEIKLGGFYFSSFIELLKRVHFVKFIRNMYNAQKLINDEIDIDSIKELVDYVITYNLEKSKLLSNSTVIVDKGYEYVLDEFLNDFEIPDYVLEQIKGNAR